MLFRDRTEAGQRLANELLAHRGEPDLLVLGLPRGGVPVACEVAKALNAPLDIFLVRKLGVPGQEELAFGAIASGGIRVLNQGVVQRFGISNAIVDVVTAERERELERRERVYRAGRLPVEISGRTVILVDDGIATGSTMRAAIAALRSRRPRRLVVAVPVAPPATCQELEPEVDELVCLAKPEWFYAIAQWYENFRQITDEEVQQFLATAHRKDQKAA